MNTPANAMPESQAQPFAPAVVPESRRLYWLIRREFWENRSIYIAPLAVATAFLLGSLIPLIHLPAKLREVAGLSPMQQFHVIAQPFNLAGLAMMGVTTLVAVFYCIDALYGERRDRSILFWKSLPVSDLSTVLSKAIIPIIVLPLVGFVIAVGMHWIMLVISSAVLMGSGLSVATFWEHLALPHIWGALLYHLVAIHGLLLAPFYGWLLLVSAWAPRAPFLWAVLPPFAIGAVEKIAFNTTYFGSMLRWYVEGGTPEGAMFPPTAASMHWHLGLGQFLVSPNLWIGLGITAAFLALAVRVRRDRG